MTEQEKQAVEELTRSFAMEMFYKVKCTEVEARKEEIDRLESENAALRERLEKAVELTVKECLRILHNIGGCDATDDFSQGWDEAIDTAFKAISEKYGVTAEAALDDE